MRIDGKNFHWTTRIAGVLLAVASVLLPVENAFAVSNLNQDVIFAPADGLRTYMDTDGAWDGSADAAGDTFNFVIDNTGPDIAYDLKDITVDVPSGFILGQASVVVTDSPGSCSNINGITASQTSATLITIGISPNTDIAVGCSYTFALVLTTDASVTAGINQPVTFNSSYNDTSNNTGTEFPFSATELIDVRAGGLSLAKTTAEANPPDNTIVSFNVEIQNTGTGGLFDVRLSDVLGTGLINLNIIPPASPTGSFSGSDYIFDYIPGGTTVNVTVEARTDIDPASPVCPTLTNTASVIDRTGIVVPDSTATIPFDFGNLTVAHVGTSRCVLCGTGTVTLRLTNTSAVDFNNIVISENLLVSELQVVDGTSSFGGAGIANPVRVGQVFTWTLPAATTVPANSSVDLVFDVEYDVASFGINEDLAGNDTTIQATVDYELSCGIPQPTINDPPYLLTLDQPLPQVTKLGRNVDAGQDAGTYTATVYGHQDDDVIWRVRILNSGPVDLEDVLLDDTITGNFDINYVCASEADASQAAAGAPPAACSDVSAGVTTTVANFIMNDPFGVAGPEDVLAGTFEDIFYVGRIRTECNVRTNTANIEWGCDADTPPSGAGGLSSVDVAGTTDTGVAQLSTRVSNGLTASSIVEHSMTGLDGTQPVGSNGIVTVTIQNDTGGTIKGDSVNGLVIDIDLPDEYVMDTTAPLTFTYTEAYGNTYNGVIDTITHTNLNANLLLNNTPQFALTSTTTGDAPTSYDHLFRNGDEFTISFQVVLVDPAHFDRAADIDASPEDPTTDTTIAPIVPTDPDNAFTILNDLTVTYDDTCDFTNGTIYNEAVNFQADVEDLDLDMSSNIYVLTDTDPVNLDVDVINNGGHDAANYFVYVAFGDAMTVLSAPAGCNPTALPLTHPEWNVPDGLFAYQNIYVCSDQTGLAPIGAGQTLTLVFNVEKDAAAVNDDLTFRADVTGEITLFDGTALVDPAPTVITTSTAPAKSITPIANNYTQDAFRSRVIGFNLTKVQSGLCSEDASVPVSGDTNVIIGEECTYTIRAGGWFGFDTPGFALIAVEDVTVTDDLPELEPSVLTGGQGYIDHTTTLTGGIDFVPAPADPTKVIPASGAAASLDQTDIDWFFNPAGSGITNQGEWFEVDITTRILNDAIDDSVTGPNLHASTSSDVARASFTAVFDTTSIFVHEYRVPSIPGFPAVVDRQVDMTVTEPSLSVVKEVCNETLSATKGAACSPFSPTINFNDPDAGDTQDEYVYRVIITNEANSLGVDRAPAYNVAVTDELDASDLMVIAPLGLNPFANDGLDNDGDGLIDGADGDGEFFSLTENVADGVAAASFVISHEHSNALDRIDPGQSVTFYYRVDPDDAVAPLQTLSNTVVDISYDSLDGDFGNQSPPQLDNTEVVNAIGRARLYNAVDVASASIQMLPLQSQPKQVITLSNTLLGAAPHDVVVGEEIEYQLHAQIPVANLRQFTIRDELPAGLRCIEGQVVNLNAAPYSDAGFSPGGTFTPTCTNTGTNDYIEWSFGDQELTAATSNNLFDFRVSFIARVENTRADNTTVTLDNTTLRNAGEAAGGTVAEVTYVNELGATITIPFDGVDVVVREPQIVLTKTFTEAITDAGDVLTVTVTAENTGSATAYNLQVLDDLVGSNMTYLGNIGGTDPPNSPADETTLGANRPIFSWTGLAIPPLTTISFTFEVTADITAQPLENLENTIQASWTSLPSTTTALNATGSIDADGSATGMRNGVLPNDPLDTINDYETTATDSVDVPALTMSKTDLDPAIVPTIGAHKHFRIEILLPEGTTNNLVVTDDLVAGSLSYMLANNTDFDISYDFQGIASINGGAVDEASFSAFPADNTITTATWSIGTVVTQFEDDPTTSAITPRIWIDYYARAENIAPSANAGDTMQNAVDVDYTHGETGGPAPQLSDNTAAVTVVEPVLTATKIFSNITSPGVAPDAGDIIEYTVSISNANGPTVSTAYDVNIVDTLPAELLFDTSFTPTAILNGSAVAGFVSAPSGAPTGPLIWGRGNGDDSLDIPPNQILVLTYRTVVQNSVEPNQLISNSVWFDWTSLDSASLFETDAYERTGAGCPVITAPNDYCASATVPFTIIDDNTVVKTIINDSYDVAPLSTAVDSIVRVGDTVTYRLALTLQEGSTDSVSLQDSLPAGLEFVDVVSINGDTSASYDPPASGAGSNFAYASITAASVPAAGATGVLTWTLGNIINDAQGDATTDTLVIEYRARVVEDILPHVASTTLINSVDLAYIDGNGLPSADPATTPRLRSTATLTVLQPILASVTKVDRDGSPVSGDPVIIATDIMNFQLQTCNTTGQAPAYGIDIVDDLPTQINETSISGPTNGALQPDVRINGVLQTTGVDYVYTPPAVRGGQMAFVIIAPVNPGECVDIDFDVGFYTDFGGNQSWANTVSVDEYWSLPADAGQQYLPALSAVFNMNNVAGVVPPAKTLLSPVSAEATIGEEVVYRISVPATPANGALYDVVISDTLDDSLIFVSAVDTSTSNFIISNNTVLPNLVSLSIDHIPAGEQAIIELRARVDNVATANAGDVFNNTVAYTYAIVDGGVAINGGNATTVTPLRIVEPTLTMTKAVLPATPPDAGDVLTYTLTVNALGGAVADNFSDAFDLSIDDSLSLGLAYAGNPVITAGYTIAAPTVTGDGVTTPQTLSWNTANGTDIDVIEGSAITISYDVVVLDSVLANQALTNAVDLRWTSINGTDANERDGSETPAYNDYRVSDATTLTTPDTNTLTKTRLSDTSPALTAVNDVRIGDIVEYELRLSLQEGTHPNFTIVDSLPQGLQFEEIVSINGDTAAPYAAVAPFTYSDFVAVSVTGNPLIQPSSVTWSFGDVVNTGDNLANNDFVIVYRARVLDLVQTPLNNPASNINLLNSANLAYDTFTVAGAANDPETVVIQQPNLSVSKVAVEASGNGTVEAGELITYTVEILNSGNSPAYDTVLQDIIPLGLRNGTATLTMVSTELLLAGALPNLAPVYDAATGVATWDYDTGVSDAYSIPAGDTLRIVYQVQAEAGIAAGVVLTNSAQVLRYHSFDDEDVPVLGGVTGVREIYGPSNIAAATLNTPAPAALDKQNTVATASIGEPFSYRIVIPATPQPTALHDVRILDDLTASAADLEFISVSRIPRVPDSVAWTPVNTGTATNLVIEDITTGIEIPANEQVEIEITVMLSNTVTNVDGLLFNNTASYTFNQIDNDASTVSAIVGVDTTANMTVVEPELNLTKTGPATIQFGTPETFTLNVHNAGTGTAWDVTILDRLPDPSPGGMCDTPPANIIVQPADNASTPVGAALVEGTDYVTSFVGVPSCELTVTMQSAAASIAPDQRLLVSYEATLDVDNTNASTLTNIAGTTQWFSWDTAGAGATGQIREYTEVLTDGTVGTLDHEDAYTVTIESSELVIQKTVVNMTTGQDPGVDASPGDTLRYRITVTNTGSVPVVDFSLTDEPDRLTTPPGLFAPGTMAIVNVPVGADSSNTDINAGANGAGILDVRSLNLDAAGGANDSLFIEFDVTLAPVLINASQVLNQAEVTVPNFSALLSDDPNVNGIDDPAVFGDEDPTLTVITSAPAFQVEKTSQDMTGDPAILEAGDTLRYTITVKNIGDENAVNVQLRDLIPANTTYDADSTTLNGVDLGPDGGVSPLQTGLLINAPENTTAGYMRADASATTDNVATVTFDVVVNSNVVVGTVISNQGYVSGEGEGAVAFPEQPSDDPDTVIVDDPTIDVVGNVPLLDAQKTVQIWIDNGTPGQVDTGDTLRYTIVVSNVGAVAATGVMVTDAVPADTSYVADSVTLNGLPVGQPDAGVSPLEAGIDVSSSDLTPPLPTAGNGVVNAGQAATITFDVLVTGLPGTIISNQGTVSSVELPDELTDWDGNDANGDQPTLTVVGNVQLLAITKEVFVVNGGAALAGEELEYVVTVTNIGTIPATDVYIRDDLDVPVAGQLIYIANSAELNGAALGTNFVAPLLTADYSTSYGDLQPGDSAVLRFRAQIEPTLPRGTTITNTAEVSWDLASPKTALATVSIDEGGTPGVANLHGEVWHDSNYDNAVDGVERMLAGWSVDLYRSGIYLDTVQTDANGVFDILGLPPSTVADPYELRYRAPGAAANAGSLGYTDSDVAFTDGHQRITNIYVVEGSNTLGLNLPIDPNGVVYDSVLRTPVSGATVTMLRASTGVALPASCFDDPNQQDQVTAQDGYYKFDLNFSQPECVSGADYIVQVAQPGTGYVASPSLIIPPITSVATVASFDVPACLGSANDVIPATANHCETQDSEFAPATSVPPRTTGTNHYLKLTLDNNVIPGESQLFNNHIPIDPDLSTAVAVAKTSALLNVSRGQLVPYTITMNNTLPAPILDLDLVDRFPAGFKYVEGSARVNGVPMEPTRNGLQLTWTGMGLNANSSHTIKLLLVVGAGVNEGEYINRAQAINNLTLGNASGVAMATVRVVPDPTFDCSDVIGKVFEDRNLNGYQDDAEPGIASARLVTARGLQVTTDEHGRFHITCAMVPNQDRGSNFILKLDERSLPSGYRLTTENPRVQRATRGKMLKYNFGAAIHRVVRLDMADGVFEPGSTEMRPQWKPRLDLLLEQLQKAPSILRLSYMAEVEDEDLVDDRLEAVQDTITQRWEELNCCYKLMIETELFWRAGEPGSRGEFDD